MKLSPKFAQAAFVLAFAALQAVSSNLLAQGTAFTYQGKLDEAGQPASGSYDFSFSLFDSETGGTLVAGPVTNSATTVSNGLFAQTLDFGPGAFDGNPRWLEIGVRTNGDDAFTDLTTRQAILPAPYAMLAARVAAGAAVQSINGLTDNVTLEAGANVTITPNGNTLTIDSLGAGGTGIWQLNGPSTYFNGGNVGIGTSTPESRLHVHSAGQTSPLILSTGSGSEGPADFKVQADSGLFGQGPSLVFYDQVAAKYRMVINGYGGVGINTPTPTSLLHVHSSGSTCPITLTTTTGSEGPAIFKVQADSGLFGQGPSLVLYDQVAAKYRMVINGYGGVGINTTTPASLLHVHSSGSTCPITLTTTTGSEGPAIFKVQADSGLSGQGRSFVIYDQVAAQYRLVINGSGKFGIGTTTPQSQVEIAAQDGLGIFGYQPFLTIKDANAGYARSRIQGVGGNLILEPESYINGSNPNSSVTIANSGNVSLRTLTIRGGADVAEPFEISETNIEKGSVVVIDPENPGKLKLSGEAYDQRVAGVVSGANGIHPGISLRQEGTLENGENVALSGRVYVKADAAHGSIKPGDLLTTSDTPGHAMRVADHGRAQGAILGKAMSSLDEGRGMVLVLVTLQ